MTRTWVPLPGTALPRYEVVVVAWFSKLMRFSFVLGWWMPMAMLASAPEASQPEKVTPKFGFGALSSSTSVKSPGGVSAKDARAFAQEMHTSEEFMQGARKDDRRGVTEFACHVRNATLQAVKVSVPLGFLERQPRLSDEKYARLIDENHRRYCA